MAAKGQAQHTTDHLQLLRSYQVLSDNTERLVAAVVTLLEARHIDCSCAGSVVCPLHEVELAINPLVRDGSPLAAKLGRTWIKGDLSYAE